MAPPTGPSGGRRAHPERALRQLRRLPITSLVRGLIRRVDPTSGVFTSILDLLTKMVAASPLKLTTEVLPTTRGYDRVVALGALRRVSTLVLVGARDLVTPAHHGREIAAAGTRSRPRCGA